MHRPGLWWAAAGLAMFGAVASLGWAMHRSDEGWREVAWPFPQDAWPAGRAFRCGSKTCGGEMEVYLRPKRGFCANCAAGVTEDAEVDGVADLDMISADFVPAGPGQQVAIGALAGRARSYTIRFPNGTRQPAAGIALSRSRQCDLFVAASLGPAAGTREADRAIATLLVTTPVEHWIRVQLGG